jgi:hypothetical protein
MLSGGRQTAATVQWAAVLCCTFWLNGKVQHNREMQKQIRSGRRPINKYNIMHIVLNLLLVLVERQLFRFKKHLAVASLKGKSPEGDQVHVK